MVEERSLSQHRILRFAKIREELIDEIISRLFGLGASDCKPKIAGGAHVFGELSFYKPNNFSRDSVRTEPTMPGLEKIRLRWPTVLGIEVPSPPSGSFLFINRPVRRRISR